MARIYNHPPASSALVRKRMKDQKRGDTACELAIRSLVHARGLRYRLHQKPLNHFRRHADLVFRKQKVAVFIDGCFWHGCPIHGSRPKTNSKWWKEKIARNVLRDEETNRTLQAAGWRVIRIWEHEQPHKAAKRIADFVRQCSFKKH